MPTVSVIVPTFRRPGLVARAVRHALDQSFRDLEVVVVVDGLDAETVAALEPLGDERLRVLVPPRNLGNAAARNHAIAAAEGDWIALLDDDDYWTPTKLETQLAAAREARGALPLVACRLIARGEDFEYVWPRRLPRAGEPLCEYIFCRSTPATGEGVVHPSTVLAPRRLFEMVPFDDGLDRYVDLDWMLRVGGVEGVEVIFAGQAAMAVVSIDEHRARISNASDWRWDVEWAAARRHLMTPRAHAAFLLTLASIRARRAGDRSAFWPILRMARGAGPASAAELAFHVGNRLFPARLRHRLTAPRRRGNAGPPA
jgi:glycosyltransferase involved in cell wall biosynthesis